MILREEQFVYRSPEELAQLSEAELAKLWDVVPTEDRDFLERRYAQAVREKGVGDDEKELQLLKKYREAYIYQGLVPAGKKWLKLSPKLRLTYLKEGTEQIEEERQQSGFSVLFWLMIVGGLLILGILGMNLLRGKGEIEESLVSVRPSFTPSATASATDIPTATASPTATPLALIESDRFIEAGENAHAELYPVQLQLYLDENAAPRVFIVQAVTIETTEWRYDPNPDVASWLLGTHIRPVLGLPYSETNAVLLAELQSGSLFVLRMNTGLELHFRLSERQLMGREDTSWLRQSSPGLLLTILGESDPVTGMPTAQRLLLLGRYETEGELRQENQEGLPHQATETFIWDEMDWSLAERQLLANESSRDDSLVYAHVQLSLRNRTGQIKDLSGYSYTLLLGESRYSPDSNAQSSLGIGPNIVQLAAGETGVFELAFLLPRSEASARLLIRNAVGLEASIFLDFTPLPLPARLEYLDVQVRAMSLDAEAGRVYVDLRAFNPQETAVELQTTDITMIFGFSQPPTGPSLRPLDFSPQTIPAQSAVDLRLSFAWNGLDPFARFSMAAVLYDIVLLPQ